MCTLYSEVVIKNQPFGSLSFFLRSNNVYDMGCAFWDLMCLLCVCLGHLSIDMSIILCIVYIEWNNF